MSILENIRPLLFTKVICRKIKKAFFPIHAMEAGVFFFFFFLYGFLGYYLYKNTALFNIDNLEVGSYLGYDNLNHLRTNGGAFDISHPLFNCFHILKYLLSSLTIKLVGTDIRIPASLLLMNALTSGGLLFIYKYLRQITTLSIRRSLLLTLFAGSFFTTIILSFTIETYPFSFFFLILSLFILSKEYKESGYFRRKTIFFLSFLCGGITITNAVKPLMAELLNKTSFTSKIRTGCKALLPLIMCTLFLLGTYSIKNQVFSPEEPTPLETTIGLKQYFVFQENFTKQIFTDFWGSSILSPPLTPQTVGTEQVIRPDEYLYGWQKAVTMFYLILILIAACINIRNKWVQLIVSYFCIDLIIHFVFRYGMNEAIIFGGHWLFIIPMLLGWLYVKIPKKLYLAMDWILLGSIGVIATMNYMEIFRSFVMMK